MRNLIIGLMTMTGLAIQAPALAGQNSFEPVFSAPEPAKAARPLEAYVGRFGPATMTMQDGKLFAKVPEGLRRLTPLGGNAFAVEGQPGIRAEFQFEGNAVRALELVRPDGSRMRQERTGA